MTARTWRLAASNTHLYRGARLRCLEEPAAATFATGDSAIVEFADGRAAAARIVDVQPLRATLAVAPYRTARGAEIAARHWHLVPGGRCGELRVHSRAGE